MNPDSDRRVYTLRATLGACAFDIRVNDGPVFERSVSEPGTVEIDVNRWVHNGANSTSALLKPDPGLGRFVDETRLALSIFEKDLQAPESARRELLKLEHRGPAPPERLLGEFNASVPFPDWSWLSAPQVVDDTGTLEALTREIIDFRRLLADRALDEAVARVHFRDLELAIAHYETLEAVTKRTRLEYEFVTDPGRGELQPVEGGALMLRIFGNARLARLDRRNGTSPIFFRSLDRKFTMYVPLVFCRSGNGWAVIR